MGIIIALKFPLKLLAELVGKRRKKVKDELAEKQWKHVRNFAPAHYSWQKSVGKSKRKGQKKRNRKVNSSKKN